MRIATFNLENWDEGGRPSLEERIAILRPQILRLRADILCFQEVNGQERDGQPRRLLALAELLAETPYREYEIVYTKTTNHEAYDKRNLVIASRFPILASEQLRNDLVPLLQYKRVTSLPPDDEPNNVVWERPMLYAKLNIGRGILHVINLHLKSRMPTSIPGQSERFGFKTSSAWAEGYFLSSMKRVGQALETRLLVDRIFDEDPAAMIVVCGDFNSEPGEVPVEAILGRVVNTQNGKLVHRQLVPCDNTIPESSRFTHLHHGQRNLLDHMVISRGLLGAYKHAEIHNEILNDETIAFASDTKFPGSDHAPFILELED